MANRMIGDGKVITVTAGGTISKGDVAEFADSIGVYLEDAVSGDAVAVALAGEALLAKEAPLVITVGDKVYWDATNDNIDKTNTNIPAGIAAASAASADTVVRVLLNAGA